MDEAKRKAFLGRLSKSLGRTEVPTSVEPFDYSKGPQGKLMQNMSRDEIVELFKAECKKNNTKYVEATKDNLYSVLMDVIKDWGNGKVIYPDAPELDEYKLRDAFNNNTNQDVTFVKWDAEKGRDYCIGEAQNAEMGITFATLGIAETATVLQRSDVGSGRSVGLLPLVHIAVIKTKDIYPRMTQSMQRVQEIYDADPAGFPSNFVHITGPSSTADIELVRVVGVHGPVNISYVLVNED